MKTAVFLKQNPNEKRNSFSFLQPEYIAHHPYRADGCSDYKDVTRFWNATSLVYAGNCTNYQKLRKAQQAGAKQVIIISPSGNVSMSKADAYCFCLSCSFSSLILSSFCLSCSFSNLRSIEFILNCIKLNKLNFTQVEVYHCLDVIMDLLFKLKSN